MNGTARKNNARGKSPFGKRWALTLQGLSPSSSPASWMTHYLTVRSVTTCLALDFPQCKQAGSTEFPTSLPSCLSLSKILPQCKQSETGQAYMKYPGGTGEISDPFSPAPLHSPLAPHSCLLFMKQNDTKACIWQWAGSEQVFSHCRTPVCHLRHWNGGSGRFPI